MTEISSNSQEGKQIGQQEGKKVVIELDNVKRNFLVGDEVVHALKGVSFKIYEGEFVTIMGNLVLVNLPYSTSSVVSILHPVVNIILMESALGRCPEMTVLFLETERLVLYSRTTTCCLRRQV